MGKLSDKLKSLLNKPKLLVVIGIVGILLIYLSGFLPSSGDKTRQSAASDISAEEYRDAVNESVRSIVTGITGDKDPTVIVTLETGMRYDYANAKESDTSASSGGDSAENRKATKQSYITVRTSDGGETPLIVTEFMPQIRGVAIVCYRGNDPDIAEKIENAVTAALDITSQRVYVSGGISNEKG